MAYRGIGESGLFQVGGNVFIMIMSHHDAWARRPAMHWQSGPTPAAGTVPSPARPGRVTGTVIFPACLALPGWQAVQPPGQAGRARGLTEPARLRRSLSLRLAVTVTTPVTFEQE